jgi:glutathione peroxidase
MKYLLSSFFFVGLVAFVAIDPFYSLPLKNIDGQFIHLSSYRGKKILFVILPGSVGDSSVTVEELDSLLVHHDNLMVVGIPAEETGYRDEDRASLKNTYSQLPSSFILAEGMKVSKGGGEMQSPLFSWLTRKERNGYYDTDAQGSGYKFFVNADGRLYAVISGNTRLSNPVINKILAR